MRVAITVLVAAAACGGGEPPPVGVDARPPIPIDAVVDSVGPTVIFYSPELGATDVSAMVAIAVVFDEPVAPASVTSSSIAVTDAGGVAQPFTATIAGAAVQLATDAPLVPLGHYDVTVSQAVTDLAGNPLTAEVRWSFLIAAGPDVEPPHIVYLSPAPAEQDVALSADVHVFFDEVVDSATVTAASVELTMAGDVQPTTLAASATTVVMTPDQPLSPITTYRAKVKPGVADLAGNHLEVAREWNFTTIQSSPWSPAHVIEPFSQGIGSRKLATGPAGQLVVPALRGDTPELIHGHVGKRENSGEWNWTPIPDDVPRPYSIDGGTDDSGRTHVVWSRFSLANVASGLFASSIDAGGSWSAVEQIDPSGWTPSVHVAPTGVVIVAWRGYQGTETVVKVRRYQPGTGWLPTETIPNSSPSDEFYASMDVWVDGSGDRAVVVWGYKNGLTEQVWAASRDAAGWSTPLPMGTGSVQRDPDLAFNDAGFGMVVWMEINSGVGYVSMVRRYDGTTWSAAESLDSVVSSPSEDPHVAVSADGTAIASWTRYPPMARYVAARRWSGSAWEPVKTFETAYASNGSAPAISATGDGIVGYEWHDVPDDVYEIHAASYVAGAGWGPSYRLGGAGINIHTAVSSSGVPIVMWHSFGFANTSLFASEIE